MNKIREILEQSKGRAFTVTFKKKDGSLRTLNCRLGVKKYLAGGSLRYNPEEKGLLPVFDMQEKSYKMVNLNTISSIKLDGREILVMENLLD